MSTNNIVVIRRMMGSVKYYNRKYIRAAIVLCLVCLSVPLVWLVSYLRYCNNFIGQTRAPNLKPEEYIWKMANESVSVCGCDINSGHILAKLSNVMIRPDYGKGRRGGETIADVINQTETEEYYTLDKGYFGLKCSDRFNFLFRDESHLNKWLQAVQTYDTFPPAPITVSAWTIAIERHDYANLCMTMGAFYNAFLVLQQFHLNPDETNILFIDGHPTGALDSNWDVLFGKVSRASDLIEPVIFRTQVWNVLEYDSMLLKRHLPSVPYLEEFRRFYLTRHRIRTDKALNCQRLTVLFLWRRDYLAHPRNPSGHVTRKIQNEAQLLNRARELLPGHEVEGRQLDKLTMADQINIITKTDILIGMHGAGLTHTLFLPKHAGLIELFPKYYANGGRFQSFCKWRGLHHSVWSNQDPKREFAGHYTNVDVDAVAKALHDTRHKMCSGSNIT